jgi:8-oxo-dGTP diphosphatase
VILRKTDRGNLKVLVAHRPQYDDWSFPKGKADKGESSAETAVREILEETGLRCRIVAPLTTTRYRVGSGMKEVEWFVMRPLPDSPGFKKNNEVDKIKWMGRKAARKLLDYDHDRGLITDFDLKKVAETGTIHLLRHATAGNRDNFNGDDRERPLTKKGKAHAKSIAESLREREIERIVTSPYKRCVQTVEPLAKMIGATIEISDALAEGPDIDAAYDLIHNLAGANAVLCSHGDVIPAAMNRLMWLGLTIHSRFYCSKGSIWEVDIEGGRYTEGRYVPPPVI